MANVKNYNDDQLFKIDYYQRELVWSKYQKQLLIDSILRGIDIPKIYLDVKDANGDEIYNIVDGQQRINTIVSFFNDEFKLQKDCDPINGFDVRNLAYSELPRKLYLKFQNYNFDAVHLYQYEKDHIAEMFQRLQEGSSLNAAEKRRGISGNVHKIICELAGHKIFECEGFLNFKNKRASFEDRCAKIFHQFYHKNITTIKPNEIHQTYKKNSKINNQDQIIKNIKSSFNFLYESLKDHSPKLAKYSLLRLTYLIHDLKSNYNIQDYASEFGSAYMDFVLYRDKDSLKDVEDRDPELIEFANCARGDSLAGQLYIHAHLEKEILKRMPYLQLKDDQRCFSEPQRRVIFMRSKNQCQADTNASWYDAEMCNGYIDFNVFHADHILPHSKGGSTSISNGQALCQPCNQKKSNS